MNQPIPNDSEEYLTKEELSDRLKLSVRTVVRWMKEGRVPFHRFGSKTVRFKWSRVQKALEERERKNSAEHGAGSQEQKAGSPHPGPLPQGEGGGKRGGPSGLPKDQRSEIRGQ